MTYSAIQARADALKLKIRRARIQAKSNPDNRLAHGGEFRDAQKGDYTLLDKRIKDLYKKNEDIWETRHEKLHGKKI